MAYRVRPLNWNLLLQPTMEGLNTEAQASSKLGSMIAGAGGEIGAGFTRKRQEAESKRRFDADQAESARRFDINDSRQREEFDLRRQDRLDVLTEKERERQANQSSLLDMVETTTQMALGGDPTALQVLPEAANALGGPAATQEKLATRTGSGGDYLYVPHPRAGSMDNPDGTVPAAPPGRAPSPGAVTGDYPTDTEKTARAQFGQPGRQMPGGNLPGQPPGSAVHAGPTMPLTATAPVPNPAVGESGVADLSSEELAVKVENAKQRITLAQKAMDTARAALRPNGLTSSADRAKATKAYNDAMTAYLAAGNDVGQYTRRMSQAAKREATAGALEVTRAAATDKAIQTAKDQANDLVAWGDPAMRQRLTGVDFANENTRREIDVMHTREKERHTAAASAREAKALNPQQRAVMEAKIEADPDLKIPDASGMKDEMVNDLYKKAVAADLARASEKRKQPNVDADNARADKRLANDEASRKAAAEARTRDQDMREVALLDREITAQKKAWAGDEPSSGPEHDAYWEAIRKRDELKQKLAGGSAPAAPASPATVETPWQKAQKDPSFASLTDAQKEALRKRLGG